MLVDGRRRFRALQRRQQMVTIAAAEIVGAGVMKLEDVAAKATSIRILAKLRGDVALEATARHIELRAERRLAWLRRQGLR